MEIIFLSIGYLSLKGKYLTCYVRHTKNKSGHILSSQCFIIWYIWTLWTKLHLKRLHKYHLGTDIIIRHTVHCFVRFFFRNIYDWLFAFLGIDVGLPINGEYKGTTLVHSLLYGDILVNQICW